MIHNLTVIERVKLSWISKSKPVGFDNEQVINHPKLINSWVAKALMSHTFLANFRILKAVLLRDYLADICRSNFQRQLITLYNWVFGTDFLADRLQKKTTHYCLLSPICRTASNCPRLGHPPFQQRGHIIIAESGGSNTFQSRCLGYSKKAGVTLAFYKSLIESPGRVGRCKV